MQIKSAGKTYTIPWAIGLAVLFLTAFSGIYLLLEIKISSWEFTTAKSDALALKAQSQELQAFKDIYSAYKPSLEKMNGLFVNPKNPVEFIKFIEKEAAAADISVKISLLASPQEKDVESSSFQLLAKDDFTKIARLVNNLENSPYVFKIDKISLVAETQQGELGPIPPNGLVSAVILIKTVLKN